MTPPHPWQGFNVGIFAYGQTGSGKTYTMQGAPHDLGFNPRFGRTLFYFIENKAPENEREKIVVEACFYEIYNEKVNGA